MSTTQRPVDESNEELRALSFVRKSLLKKNELIRQLKKQLKDLREEVENLKWRCSTQEKEIERIFSGDNAVGDETECDIIKDSRFDIDDVANKDLAELPLETAGDPGIQEFMQIKEELAEPEEVLAFNHDNDSLARRGKRSHEKSVNSFSKQIKRHRRNSNLNHVEAVIDDSVDHAMDENYLLNNDEEDLSLSNQPTEQDGADVAIVAAAEDLHHRMDSLAASTDWSAAAATELLISGEGLGGEPPETQPHPGEPPAAQPPPPAQTSGRPTAQANRRRGFCCKECGKTFADSHNLAIHRRIHTGERPFICPHIGCTYRARCKSNLNSHMTTHARGTPHAGDSTPPPRLRCTREGCSFQTPYMHTLEYHVMDKHDKPAPPYLGPSLEELFPGP